MATQFIFELERPQAPAVGEGASIFTLVFIVVVKIQSSSGQVMCGLRHKAFRTPNSYTPTDYQLYMLHCLHFILPPLIYNTVWNGLMILQLIVKRLIHCPKIKREDSFSPLPFDLSDLSVYLQLLGSMKPEDLKLDKAEIYSGATSQRLKGTDLDKSTFGSSKLQSFSLNKKEKYFVDFGFCWVIMICALHFNT